MPGILVRINAWLPGCPAGSDRNYVGSVGLFHLLTGRIQPTI